MQAHTTAQIMRKISPLIIFLAVLLFAIGFRLGNAYPNKTHQIQQELKSCNELNKNLLKSCKCNSQKPA